MLSTAKIDILRLNQSQTIKRYKCTGTKFFKDQNEKLAIKSYINGLNDPIKNILRSRVYKQNA